MMRRFHAAEAGRMRPRGRPWPALVALALLSPGVTFGAPPGETTPATAPAEPAQASPSPRRAAHDARVPVGAVRAFIDACRARDYTAAARYLDLDEVPAAEREAQGPRLARQLKFVLDQKLWIHYERLSAEPAGNLDDGLPPDLERVGVIKNGAEVDVLLARVADGKGGQTWKFAPSTVAAIPQLNEEYGYGALGEWLPGPLFEISFFEVRLVQWIGLVLLVVLAYLVAWIAVRVLQALIRPLVAKTSTELDDELLAMATGPLRFLCALGVFAAGSYLLRLAAPVYAWMTRAEMGLTVVGLTWLALRFVDVGSILAVESLERSGRTSAKAVIPLGRRSIKVFLIALAAIALLQNLGFHVTGLLAGLGVGGLAVALAAQKSIENLFGGVTLVTDQPVRVGDFCRFADGKLGTVEEIGLRSTRVRTLDRTLVAIPNSQFSEFQLENFGKRDQIRLVTILGLRYETSPDQLRYVLAELRRILIAHPRVAPEPLRVRFSGFGAHSLDVEVYAMIRTTDYNEFCAIREDLFLRFMRAVTDGGTGFAFPSQTLYMGRDDGLDAGRKTAAESAVQTWREKGSLPFPDFAPEINAELDDTLDYPPAGSPGAPGS